MALVAAVCPNCGGKINVDDTKEAGVCESCGTPFVTEKVIHQNVTNNNFAGATVNMSIAVNEQKQFENAMQMTMDAYNANNEEECKSFCNQALSVNPKSADAKALKGAAILISFTLAGATSDAVEALEIWKSISDEPSDEYCKISVDAAFDFRSRWLKAAEAHYNEFRSVDGAEAEFKQVQSKCNSFIKRFAETQFVQNYEPFSDFALQTVKRIFEEIKNCDWIGFNEFIDNMGDDADYPQILANANKSRTDSIGTKAKQILELFESIETVLEEHDKKRSEELEEFWFNHKFCVIFDSGHKFFLMRQRA